MHRNARFNGGEEVGDVTSTPKINKSKYPQGGDVSAHITGPTRPRPEALSLEIHAAPAFALDQEIASITTLQ